MADWDETNPSNSDIISQFPQNERDARAAVRTNFGVDHRETDDSDVGKHEQVTLLEQASDPGSAANQGRLYTKDDGSGNTEVYYIDESGNVEKLTPVGSEANIPVSTTSSGGTAGTNYDVADWPGTLVSGRVYYARVHADNIGTFTIDSGGGAVSALRHDGSIPQPLDVQKDAIHAFYFNGTNVLITPKQYKIFAATSITQGSGDKTRIARVELFAQFQDVRFSFLIHGNGSGAGVFATPPAVVHVKIRQSSALGNQPEVEIEIENADKQSFASDCVHAHYGTIDATSSALHIYIADGAQKRNLAPIWRPIFIHCGGSSTIEYFDSSGTATIGSLETTSRAAQGEVVAEESFAIGGDFSDTGYAKSVRGVGGNWVNLWIPIMSHTSDSSPAAANAVPAQYRPASGDEAGVLYYSNANAVYNCIITESGSIVFSYRNWAGSSFNATSTGHEAIIPPYFVPDP